MIGWLSLTDEQRKATIDEAARLSGINPKAIEKDWWVTLILKALFECEYAPLMIFKGGTSLSKCWNLIERFSEDIDIALNPKAFSHKHKKNPTSGEVRRLKRAGCVFISTLLKETLQKQLGFIGVPPGKITILSEAIDDEMPDKDPQTLFATYISLYDPHPYLQDAVKIEVSVRSLMEPHRVQPTSSMLYQYFPNPAYLELPLNIASVEPRKTFLEKVFLLHEEFLKPEIAKIRIERMSRHLYDLSRMSERGIDIEALNDLELYDAIVLHRTNYSRLSWVNYATLGRNTISFLPPAQLLNEYKADYIVMQENMIHGETVVFEELIERLVQLNSKFRNQ